MKKTTKNNSGINGTGIDIVEISRIRDTIKKSGKKFISRVFTKGEIFYCMHKRFPEIHFAGRFAAKEAIVKAMGVGFWRDGVSWKDLDIVNNSDNKPAFVKINGNLKRRFKNKKVLISMSHSHNYAVANAIIYSET